MSDVKRDRTGDGAARDPDARARDPRALARDALRAAADGPEPDMGRLLAAMPAMMAEARRRRLGESEAPLAALVPLASRLIPRLAAAAAALAILATVTLAIDLRARGGERNDIDAVLTDTGRGASDAGDTGSVDDLLLARPAAVLGEDNG
jgi:hypothetical protein